MAESSNNWKLVPAATTHLLPFLILPISLDLTLPSLDLTPLSLALIIADGLGQNLLQTQW
jgi:hypothetical protein